VRAQAHLRASTIALLAVLSLSGCAPKVPGVDGTPFSEVERAPADKTFIYVYRLIDETWTPSRVDFRVLMDGRPMETVGYGAYVKFAVPPGWHVLTSDYATGSIMSVGGLIGTAIEVAARKPGAVTIEARAGENVYVKLHATRNVVYLLGTFSQVPESTALKEMKATNLEKE
jgi:hypothetical protein